MERAVALSASVPRMSASNICRTKEACTGPDFFSGRRDLSSMSVKVVQGRKLCRRVPEIYAAQEIGSSSEVSLENLGGRWMAEPWGEPSRSVDVHRLVSQSVNEIITNIQAEAPFLQYVFETGSKKKFDKPQRQRVSPNFCESPDSWPEIQESLSRIDPDGVILVQKLGPKRPQSANLGGDEMVSEATHGTCGETNVWGMLVQARGLDSHACYLLETTSITMSHGRLTRSVLIKATPFGPSYTEQLENAWLAPPV